MFCCVVMPKLGSYSRIRYSNNLHSSGMLLLFFLLLYSSTQDQLDLPSSCSQGLAKAKCICSSLEVNCTGTGLINIPVGLDANIKHLILQNNLLSSLDNTKSQLPQSLVSIDASQNFITFVDWSSLSSLTNLEELYLQRNYIHVVDFSYFYGSKLRILNVSGNQLININVKDEKLQLQELYIERCGLNYFEFGASSSFCELKILYIGGNSFPHLPSDAFSCMSNLQEIKLNDLHLISLSSDVFSKNKQIQLIDLSNNLLTTLPATIFHGLDKLRALNLAGNPWSCDCRLTWLKLFMNFMLRSGGTIVNNNVMYCSTGVRFWDRITELAASAFCTKNSAACVYDFSSQNYSVIQFSGEINGINSSSTCRDACLENNNKYLSYDRSSSSCMCGDVVNSDICRDCNPSLLSWCNSTYNNVNNAISVVSDVTVSFSPLKPHVMAAVNFRLNGVSSLHDIFFWNFGDGTTRSVLINKTAVHTFIYPGHFEVSVGLASSSLPHMIPIQVAIQLTVVSTSDIGKIVCPSSVVKAADFLNVSAIFTSAWNQQVRWIREDYKLNGQSGSMEVEKECQPQWTPFRNRCIKAFMSASTYTTACSACHIEGARLLRFYSKEEISVLKSSFTIFQNAADRHYYTGAEWFTSLGAYVWSNTTEKAHVFKETLPNAAKGSCVALTNVGLQGVACSESLPFICEKDPVTCLGSWHSDSHTCYVMVSQPATWQQAHLACQSTFTNGRLASIVNSSQNSYVSGLLTSQAWIGLRAWTTQGYYTWQDGQTLSGYSNLVNNTGVEPCVSMNSSGLWQPEMCSKQNNYICEYFVGGELKIPWLVAGFVPVMSDISSPVAASVVASPVSVISSFVTLLLDSRFSTSGYLLRWNIQVKSLNVDTKLTLQVWRPVCTAGSLIWPECGNSTSSQPASASTQTVEPISRVCQDGEYMCSLSNICLPIAKPCTCLSASSISSLSCQNQFTNYQDFKLQLVYMTTIRVPLKTSQLQFELKTEVIVQEGDIIGFQSENKDAVICEESTSSEWRNDILSAKTDYWMTSGFVVDPQVYQMKSDVVCRINAVYSTNKATLSPVNLNFVTGAGVYNFTVVTTSASSQTCSVTAMEDVRELLWVYPKARVQVITGQGPPVLNINVEAGKPYDLTVKLLQGTEPSVTWYVNNGSGVVAFFVSNCSMSVANLTEICQFHSSLLESPYSSLSHVFPSGSSLTNIVVNVTNTISWEALHVSIFAYAAVTEVEFYHDKCSNRTACNVTVETGKTEVFHVHVKSGDMTDAVFYEDGNVISTAASDILELSRMFNKSATYILSVNVSNPLSWMMASLIVDARIKANFQNLKFNNIFDKIAVGDLRNISASVKVTTGAYISITWMFNEDSFQSRDQVITPDLHLSHTYRFSATGNVTITLSMCDMFENSLSSTFVVEVYNSIDVPLNLSTSSRYVPTNQDFNLTICMKSDPLAESVSFGMLIYTVDWNDGSEVTTWRNTEIMQELQYKYKTAGSFTIVVAVQSIYNSSNIQTGTIIITTQDIISGLNLTYDGPKHFSENVTFTAALQAGSDVEYMVDFGDNVTVSSLQTDPVFIYKYFIADVYWAVVTARNAVSEKTYKLTLYVYDENLLRIIGINVKSCVPVGKQVAISANVATEDPRKLIYAWTFGNGDMKSGSPMIHITTSYSDIGIYTISLTVVKAISKTITDYHKVEICVEEEIADLSVIFETPLALKKPGVSLYAAFHASVRLGSNLTYTWTINNAKDIAQDSTLNLTVTEAKVYNVTVKVENKLNSLEQTMELTAIEVITGLQMQCPTCSMLYYTRTQHNTTLEASLLHGTLVNYAWSINNSVISKTGKSVQYSFRLPGFYLVKLVANNSVSNESVVMSIIAQDEVKDVHISTNLSIVGINANVTFQATFTSGTSVGIIWKCDTIIFMGNNSTSLIHAFTSAGYHQCSVVIFNDVSSMNESIQIAVLDYITDVSINQSLEMKPGSASLYAIVGKIYTFTPHTSTHLLVDFEWEMQEAEMSSVISNASILKYTFKANGTYKLTLTAKNAISSNNVSVTVEAQENVSNVHITTNKTSPVQIFVGESVLFQVAVGTGSNLKYLWSSGRLTQLSQNDSVVVPFHLDGNFTVQVSVMNDISTMTDKVLVSVYVRVSNVTIQVKQSLNLPFVMQGTVLYLYCQSVSGSALTYTWTITHVPSGRQFITDLMSISFNCSLTGMYKVHLMVKNALSSEEDQLILMVQGAVTELRVTIQDSVIAAGSSLTLTGDVNLDATDVTFMWKIDGEVKTAASFFWLFPVVGVFKVWVTAANNVSSMSKEKTIRVLDPISNLQIADCHKIRMAQVATLLQATIKTGTNVTYTWFLEINKQNTTYAGQNISINFQTAGFYNVVLKADNDINTKTNVCQLQLQLPISHASLSVTDPSSDYIIQNQNVTFTATGNNLFSAVFEWKFANSSSVISKSNKFVTSIPTPGNYVAAVIISNGVSQVEVSLKFTVKEFLCQELPYVSRVGAPSRSLLRSQRLELEVAIDARNCTSYLAVHKWTVVKVHTECAATVDTHHKVNIGDAVTSKPSLVINPRVLDIGVYCVHFATGYQYTSISFSVFYTVNVTASKLKAVIRGGNKRTIAVGSELHFDGTLSTDFDNSKSALSYQWSCVGVNTTVGCFANSTNNKFSYKGFQVGEYRVILQVDSTGRIGDTTEQIIVVINASDCVPVSSVVCESCLTLGNYRLSSSQHVVLSSACENCQCDPAFSWQIFDGKKNVTPSNSQTSTSLNKEHLVLNKWGIITDGFNYTFTVRVSCINSTSSFGSASLTLLANLPPSGGSCSFYPIEISPLEDQVTVNCSGWIDGDDPQTIISYKIYVKSQDPLSGENETYLLYSGTDSTQSVYLSSFAGKSVELSVMVGDEFGASAFAGQSLIRFKNVTLPGNKTKTEYLMEQADSTLSALIKQASPVSLLQYSIALGQELNEESVKELNAHTAGKGNQLEQTRAAVRDAVTICLSTFVSVSTVEDVQQMSFALRLLTEYRSEYLTEDSQKLLANTLQTLSRVLQGLISNGLAPDDVPLNDLLTVIRNLLHAANARVYSLQSIWEFGRTITIDNFKTNFWDLRPEITEIVGSMKFTDISLNESHRKTVVSAIVPLLEIFLVSTLKTLIVSEEHLQLDIDGIKMKASRSYVRDIKTQYISETACISVPSSVLSGRKDALDEVFQVMISHTRNPYTYGYKTLSWAYVPVQTISFYETNGSYIDVDNLADDARISLLMYSTDVDNSTCLGNEEANKSDASQMKAENYKNIILGPHKSIQISVPGGSSKVEFGVGIRVQLRFSVLSTKNQSLNSNISGVTAYLGINFIPSSNSYSQKLILANNVDQGNYTFFQNNLSSPGKLHIVATNDNDLHEVKLSVGVYFSSCEYFNTDTQTWASNGCQAQADSTIHVTSCKCNHLTSFGGAGIISITDIDFSDLENLNLLTNPVVFIVVAIILVSYIIVVILCRYLDHLDLKRISQIPLCGQIGQFLYEVTVVTGCTYNAGTSAHVGIKLYGTTNKGGARHLTKPGAFQRNCRDTFIVANSTSLGDITKILVWHDNTGFSPSWYLSHILVKDLQTESQFTFLVNSWLSLEMEHGEIQKTVKASEENETKQFFCQFKNIFHALMADLHTWFSVSNKPDHSRFTRVQRTTCCLTCVYLYMSVNAMWYGLFKSPSEVNAPLSWNSFGWEEIVVALISTIIVVPFWVGLTLIFKKSRCKASIFKEALRPGTAQTLEIDALCAFSVDGGSYRTATTVADWIPPLDRESTTDSINQIPTGLKRTAAMYKSRRRKSTDASISVKERPAMPSLGSQKNFWNKDRIMQSWPNTLPHGLSKARVLKESTGIEQNGNIITIQSGSITNKQRSQAVSRGHCSKPIEDSDEDFQMKLDQAEAEIARDEEKRKKKQNKKLRQASGDGLFDSDDDWVYEGLDDVVTEPKLASFNTGREPEHTFAFDRRTSVTSFTLPNGSSCKPGSDEGSKKNYSSLLQNAARPSIVSSSSKSKTTLSGRLRSLSVVSQMSLQRNTGCLLPSWCVYVAYTICAILSVLSVILVLLYGYNFGKNVAIKWVVSLSFTVLISILVIEPLKVLLITVYMTMHMEGKREENSDIIDIKPKIEFNEQIKDVKFRPLGGYALLQAKEEGKKTRRLYIMIREVLMFTFMFALFLAIVNLNYSSDSMYRITSNIHRKFYERLDTNIGNSSHQINVTGLRSIPDFWLWTKKVLARSLHYRDLFQTENFGILLGSAWLRQIRGKIVTCPAALSTNMLPVPELVKRCVDSGTTDPDTHSYSVGWTAGSYNWTYSPASELHQFSKFGQSLMYMGGGYVQKLGLTYNDTLNTLQQLETDGWVDFQTRAVFAEFTLYHPSKNLISCVTFVLEFPTSGGILALSSVWTDHLVRFIPGYVDPLMVCQVMFFIFILYFTIMVTATLKSHKLMFFKHLWNWIDLFTCILLWTNTGLYITSVIEATSKVNAYLADLTTSAHLEKVVLLQGVLRDVHASLVFLFSLKIVRQIRFFKPLYKFYTTLSTASAPLVGAFFIFIVILLTYAQFGYLFYGSAVYGYHSFQHSIMSLFGLFGNHTQFWPASGFGRLVTHLFFMSFGLFGYGLVTALSVAILTWSFKWSRAQMTYKSTLDAGDYEMIEFMIKHFKIITGMQKKKPAFRHVKFEGLPSLPSRCSSSHVSKRSGISPEPILAESINVKMSKEYLQQCMVSVRPKWDQVMKAVQKIEELERMDEETLKDLLEKIIRRTPDDSSFLQPSSRLIVGKPQLSMKTTFTTVKPYMGRQDVASVHVDKNLSSPSGFTSDKLMDTGDRRHLFRNKIRSDPNLDANE